MKKREEITNKFVREMDTHEQIFVLFDAVSNLLVEKGLATKEEYLSEIEKSIISLQKMKASE